MTGVGRRDNGAERPYFIAYVKGQRRLADSAQSFRGAIARIAFRLAKKHNRGETAVFFLHGNLIYSVDGPISVLPPDQWQRFFGARSAA